MALNFNQASGGFQTIQAESVPGTMPVRVTNMSNTPIAPGATVEILIIKKVNGDEVVASENPSEIGTDLSFVQIQVANS